MSVPSTGDFDFAAYRRAFETKDVAAWLEFYADDARWIEYSDATPPRAPRSKNGLAEIRAFLESVAKSPIHLAVTDEVLGPERIAFVATCIRPDGGRILEHVMLYLADGRIIRQVDLEAWD